MNIQHCLFLNMVKIHFKDSLLFFFKVLSVTEFVILKFHLCRNNFNASAGEVLEILSGASTVDVYLGPTK